jgi:hypothetical protein
VETDRCTDERRHILLLPIQHLGTRHSEVHQTVYLVRGDKSCATCQLQSRRLYAFPCAFPICKHIPCLRPHSCPMPHAGLTECYCKYDHIHALHILPHALRFAAVATLNTWQTNLHVTIIPSQAIRSGTTIGRSCFSYQLSSNTMEH